MYYKTAESILEIIGWIEWVQMFFSINDPENEKISRLKHKNDMWCLCQCWQQDVVITSITIKKIFKLIKPRDS